jgi:hypothetical protein
MPRRYADGSRYASYRGPHEDIYDALRSNDPKMTQVDVDWLSQGCGRALGLALTNNTHVSSIAIEIQYLVSSDDTNTDDLAPLLEFLRTSNSLREISFVKNGLQWLRNPLIYTLTDLIFRMIAQNPNILRLHVPNLNAPLNGIAHVLRVTTSLDTLRMEQKSSLSDVEMQLFSDAFRANKTLEALELALHQQTANLMLPYVGSHTRLRTLTLKIAQPQAPSAHHFQVLAEFLRNATVLQVLVLKDYAFCDGNMMLLLGGLSANQSITTLYLRRFHLNDAAASLLTSFVRHTCNKGSSQIREIHFEPKVGCLAQIDLGPVAHSGLDVLSLREPHFDERSPLMLGSFFEAMAKSPSIGNVSCLRVSFSRLAGIDVMTTYLPSISTLRSLVIVDNITIEYVQTKEFREAIFRNGSLISVSAEPSAGPCSNYGDERNRAFFDSLQGFCLRNQMIPALLMQPMDAVEDPAASHLPLLPSLFRVAQQAPRTAPNALLMGLLNAEGDIIGPSARRKLGEKRQRD